MSTIASALRGVARELEWRRARSVECGNGVKFETSTKKITAGMLGMDLDRSLTLSRCHKGFFFFLFWEVGAAPHPFAMQATTIMFLVVVEVCFFKTSKK